MRRASEVRKSAARAWLVTAAVLAAGCGSKSPPTSPPCDDKCRDGVALRALREIMKFAYNGTVQSKPVGHQDWMTDRFLTGSAHVFGEATSDALLGTTNVSLTYEFTNCTLTAKDNSPDQNYFMTLDGTITQTGTLAVQPSSTTALLMRGTDLYMVGTVYDPPLDFHEPSETMDARSGCALEVTQSGNQVAGKFCGRMAGFQY